MRFLNTNYVSESQTILSATDIDSNFPVKNLKHPFRSKRVRTRLGVKNLAVVADVRTTEPIDSVVLLWPKEDGIKLSSSATLRIQANATDEWSTPAVDQSLTINNDYLVASHYFETDMNYRYWRVVIEDSLNPWEYIELGVLWIGKSLAFQDAENGFSYTLSDTSKVTENEFGHGYVDEYPLQASLEFSYSLMDYPDVQIIENAFRRNGVKKPVIAILDPTSAAFDKDHYFIYGKFSPAFKTPHLMYKLFNGPQLRIEEIS